MSDAERRVAPRVSGEDVSLKLKIDEFDAITHTLNISASGVYCKVSQELPLMSRVKLVLVFPESAASGAAKRTLEVTGIVVREHPVMVDGAVKHYDVAIFFDGLTQKDKDIISQYVTRRIK